MLPKFAKIGYPLGKFRLVASVATALAVGILLVLVSTNLSGHVYPPALPIFELVRLLLGIFGNRNTKTAENTETMFTVLPIELLDLLTLVICYANNRSLRISTLASTHFSHSCLYLSFKRLVL
jgi:hypothetical protein